MKILIDTNVILDALQSRKGFLEDAGWMMLNSDKYDGYITANSITDIFYIQNKFYHSKHKTREAIANLSKIYSIIDTTATDCYNAIRSNISDFEDAVLLESAIREGMDAIVTRNTKDFKGSPVKIYTPSEFLAVL